MAHARPRIHHAHCRRPTGNQQVDTPPDPLDPVVHVPYYVILMAKTLRFDCPHCQQPIEVGISLAGTHVRCPHCREASVVPTPPSEESDVAESVVAEKPVVAEAEDAPEETEPTREEETEWEVRVPEDSLEFGPVPESTLHEWLMEGRIDAQCLLRRQGEATWHGAGELYPVLAAPDPEPATANARSLEPEPPAGLFVLLLVIAGWALLCPFLTVIGWLAAREDLAEVAAGRRRSDQRSWSLAAIRLAQWQLFVVVVLLLAVFVWKVFEALLV